MAKKRLWTRDELVVAVNLYCKIPFGQFYKGNKLIVEVSSKLLRTPSSLAMKLCNLASLDNVNQLRGVKGLRSYSRADKAIWEEFTDNWEVLAIESEEKFQGLMINKSFLDNDFSENLRQSQKLTLTEKQTIVKARIGQKFFRESVLSSYNYLCCLTENPIPELLIASHILPWSQYPKHRLNPENGLCLNRNHDAAFDRGLISFDEDYRLILSRYLMSFLPSNIIDNDFLKYRGKQMSFPSKFLPNPAFLQHHREHTFKE